MELFFISIILLLLIIIPGPSQNFSLNFQLRLENCLAVFLAVAQVCIQKVLSGGLGLKVTNFAKSRIILYSLHNIDIDISFSFQCIILNFDLS